MSNSRGSVPHVQAGAASARDLADLARSGYRLLQKPSTHVDFEVHHTADRPGYLRDNVFISCAPEMSSRDRPASVMVEMLMSAANGVGLAIGINGDPDGLGTRLARQAPGDAADLLIDDPERRVFRGAALPNPTFLFETAATFEGIISVEPTPQSVKFHHGIAIRDLIREISRVASDVAGAPLSYLQVPAQLPGHSYIGHDVRSGRVRSARRSSSLAVRFAIALQQPSSQLRFELTDILRRYCNERGFGLSLADTRIGYRSGNWFQICPHADEPPRRDRRDWATSVDFRTVEACIPITFIGPARAGSTHAIVSFLCQFPGIGIISCATMSLHDLAFIHLQLSVQGLRRSGLRDLNARLAGLSRWAVNPFDAITNILQAAGGANKEFSGYYVPAAELTKHAGDHQTVAGPVLGCTMPDKRKRIAVWFSWQVGGKGHDLGVLLAELFSCFPRMGFGKVNTEPNGGEVEVPNLEYLVSRDVGNLTLRGRGKLSVPEADVLAIFGGNGVEAAATQLCMHLEDAWKSSLLQSGVHGVSEVTVTWREWWLGHWASPIG
jgi:hypothetical protein